MLHFCFDLHFKESVCHFLRDALKASSFTLFKLYLMVRADNQTY